MRVAHFVDCYRPVINGVVTSVASLKEALEKRGHEVLVYAPSHPGFVDEEPNVHRFYATWQPFQPEDRMALPWPPSAVRRYLREKVDVVHVHTPFNLGLIGWWKARRNRTPMVFTHHTLWEEYIHYLRLPPRLGRRVALGVCDFYFRRSKKLIAPSDQVRDRILHRTEAPIEVIPTGIDPHDFQGGQAEQARQELSLDAATPLFVFVGRVGKEKSIDHLLRVFARVLKDEPTWVLAVVGGGPELEALKAYAAQLELGQSVRFMGYRARYGLKHYLAAARAFLFASQTETQGLVLLEAAAAGCPVLAVRASGVTEAVDPGTTGYLHDPGDIEGMAASILRLGRQPELAAQLGHAGVAWAQRFSSQAMAARMEELYRSIL